MVNYFITRETVSIVVAGQAVISTWFAGQGNKVTIVTISTIGMAHRIISQVVPSITTVAVNHGCADVARGGTLTSD